MSAIVKGRDWEYSLAIALLIAFLSGCAGPRSKSRPMPHGKVLVDGFPIEAKGEQRALFLVGRTDQNLVIPNDGRAGGRSGHIEGPLDVLSFGKLGRDIFFGGRAVELGAAPLAPVFGLQRAGQEK